MISSLSDSAEHRKEAVRVEWYEVTRVETTRLQGRSCGCRKRKEVAKGMAAAESPGPKDYYVSDGVAK
jgi:hypothetical protein